MKTALDDGDRSMRILAIVNGAAGGGRCGAAASRALASLRSAGLQIDELVTQREGHATELARDAFAKGRRRFLSVGGDGTAYEIVNGLFPEATTEHVELGMLPLGTGNSFLRDFRITDEDSAMAALRGWETRSIDVIRAEHSEGVVFFINLLGLGFTATVGELTNRRFKRLGPAGYIAAVVSKMVDLDKPVDPILLDDAEEDARPAVFLSFNNSKFTGGAMMMAPDADPSDGRLDIIRAGDFSRLPLLWAFPKIFLGRHIEHPKVETRRASRVEFLEERRQPVMIDGEILHIALRSLEVLPHALEVVT